MSNAVAKVNDGAALLEQVLIGGDLSKLKEADRVMYYKQVCESVGLNPLTKPFEYITLNGKLTLYALRACTEQLRQIHGVSITIVEREVVEDCYVVTARATDKAGRQDESIGAVPIKAIVGEARSNAMMKAETKAKRRVTLSICGLGMLDETEVGSIPNAITPSAGAMAALPIKTQEVVLETSAQVKALLAEDKLDDAYALWQNSKFDADQQVAFWSTLNSKQKGVLDRMGMAEREQEQPTITEAMKKRLEALIKEHKLDREGLKNWCSLQFGKGHFADLTKDEYRELDNHIATLMVPKTTAPSRAPSTGESPSPPPAPVDGATINEAQESAILDLLELHGKTIKQFLERAKVKHIADLPASRFTGAVAWIKGESK